MQNLWPPNMIKERVKSPVAILREQAALLGQQTKNLVQGEVVKANPLQAVSAEFIYLFYIVAPTLGNYRYMLFTLSNNIEMYPLKIRVEEEILNEIHREVSMLESKEIKIESEEELLRVLKAIFWAKKTRKVITSILSQADLDWTEQHITGTQFNH